MLTQYIILFCYFAILFGIGFLASKKIKDLADFYVGGKKLGYWVVAFSARATGESGWLLLGLTGMGAMVGVKAFWVVVGEVLGVAVAWLYLAKPFKRKSDQFGAITIPDYLASRFRSQTHGLRILAATALSVFVIIYVSAQIDATGSAFESFLGWNYYVGTLVGFAIVVVYISTGGFVAVAWSDLFQGLIMICGLLCLPVVAWIASGDTFATILDGLEQRDPALLNIWGTGGFSWMNLFSVTSFLMIGLGFLGSPQIFIRFMSIKDEQEIDKGTWVAIVYTLLSTGAAVAIGILGRYMLTVAGDVTTDILGNGGQDVLPMLVDHLLPATLIGVYMAAVLSAIMSTIDSLLVVASSAITRDFYQQIFNPTVKADALVGISRKVTLAMALIALAIAVTVAVLTPERTIFWFVIFGWSGIAATFCPTIILSLFWKGFTEAGAKAAMIAGFLGVPAFKFWMPAIPVIGPYVDAVSELPPAFLASLLAALVVSKMTKK